jgi:hypothetical protein
LSIRKTRRFRAGGTGIIPFTTIKFSLIFFYVERSKSALHHLSVLEFRENHHTTPENAQVARAIVDGNMQVIDNCLRKGTFSFKRYGEILKDRELQIGRASCRERV